jgi:hypothetical protein
MWWSKEGVRNTLLLRDICRRLAACPMCTCTCQPAQNCRCQLQSCQPVASPSMPRGCVSTSSACLLIEVPAEQIVNSSCIDSARRFRPALWWCRLAKLKATVAVGTVLLLGGTMGLLGLFDCFKRRNKRKGPTSPAACAAPPPAYQARWPSAGYPCVVCHNIHMHIHVVSYVACFIVTSRCCQALRHHQRHLRQSPRIRPTAKRCCQRGRQRFLRSRQQAMQRTLTPMSWSRSPVWQCIGTLDFMDRSHGML